MNLSPLPLAVFVVDATGPDHEKLFQVEVIVDGRPLGIGVGSSRRIAETAAAQRAMEILRAEAAERAADRRSRGDATATDSDADPDVDVDEPPAAAVS